jgi:hypothetical protein
MSLYLCVFAGRDELDGVEIGGYSDFNAMRCAIAGVLEEGVPGRRFPTLMLHSDCEGKWPVEACSRLQCELVAIISGLKSHPPLPFQGDWQKAVAEARALAPQNAFESFIDVDGEFVLQRMQRLVEVALEHGLPVLFQ